MKKVLPCVYRSQRDNVNLPLASCNTTSMVMALEASGYPPNMIVGLVEGQQPEDLLTQLGDSDAAYLEMRTRCPWFYLAGQPIVRPPEAPLMLDWIVEKAYGKRLAMYSSSITWAMVKNNIDSGEAVVMEGKFTPSGHIIAVVGYVGDEILTSLIVNDPWGDYNTGYKKKNGENVKLAIQTCMEVMRLHGQPEKTGHLIVRV